MDVTLSSSASGLTASDLGGVVGWPEPPASDKRLGILESADVVVIAGGDDDPVVGFATAITDGHSPRTSHWSRSRRRSSALASDLRLSENS